MKKFALYLKGLGGFHHKQQDVGPELKQAHHSQSGDILQGNYEPTSAPNEKSVPGLVSTFGPAVALTGTASSRNNAALHTRAPLSGTIWLKSAGTASPRSVDSGLPQMEELPSEVQRSIAQNRLHILGDYVTRSTGSDAHAAFLTSTESFRRSDVSKPVVQSFLDSYKESLAPGSPLPAIANASVTPRDYVYLARFHLSTVEPLTQRYAEWALAALGSSPTKPPLSETERRRIQRAMYRLETFCNLCSERSPCQMSGALDRLSILSIFHAWEVEEILCFHEFAKERVSSVFHQVASELRDMLEPYGRRLVDERGVVDTYLRNHVLSCGLAPLMALFDTTATDELAATVRQCLAHTDLYACRDDWLDGKPEVAPVRDLRLMSADASPATSKDAQDSEPATQDSGRELRFDGDSTDGPPLAWVLYWQGKASNAFGDHVPASLRRWGYVMWDAHRLDGGAMAYLAGGPPSGHTGPQSEEVPGV